MRLINWLFRKRVKSFKLFTDLVSKQETVQVRVKCVEHIHKDMMTGFVNEWTVVKLSAMGRGRRLTYKRTLAGHMTANRSLVSALCADETKDEKSAFLAGLREKLPHADITVTSKTKAHVAF